jgi:DNA gyrase/topoisomerase IV subunit B
VKSGSAALTISINRRLIVDHFPIEDIRQKILRLPEIFIGHSQWDTEALHALVGYVIGPALDPRTLNASTALTVKLEKTGMISINDNGRGMPISINQIDKTAFLEFLTWRIATGASNTRSYYEKFGFLGSIGLVLSCVSEHLKITTVWDQVLYTVSCSRGKITESLQEVGTTDERGTRITFLPDDEVFSERTFSREKLIALLSTLSDEYPQAHIRLEEGDTNTAMIFPTL